MHSSSTNISSVGFFFNLSVSTHLFQNRPHQGQRRGPILCSVQLWKIFIIPETYEGHFWFAGILNNSSLSLLETSFISQTGKSFKRHQICLMANSAVIPPSLRAVCLRIIPYASVCPLILAIDDASGDRTDTPDGDVPGSCPPPLPPSVPRLEHRACANPVLADSCY